MKAKVGNRVVNVIPDDGRFLDLSDMTYYDAADLSFDFDDDWLAFRREAAKDFMSAIIVREAPQYDVACRNVAARVAEAIMWADELVKQLQEKD